MNSETTGSMPASLAQLHPDVWTEPFWAGARDQKLLVPCCASCDLIRMPPGPFCPTCGPAPIAWTESAGIGVVHTFTVVRQAFHSDLRGAIPFVVAVVALNDHPAFRLVTNVTGIDPDRLRIGQGVEVWWDEIDEQTVIPRFSPHTEPNEECAHEPA